MNQFRITILMTFMVISSSFGQYNWAKGDLILRNGDTLSGYLKIPIINKAALANSHRVKFRISEKGAAKRYDHLKVKKLIFKQSTNDKTFEYTYIKTSKSKYQLFRILYSSDKIRLFARLVSDIGPEMVIGPSSGVTNTNTYTQHFTPMRASYPADYNEFYVQRKFEPIAHPLIKIGPLLVTKSFRGYAIPYFEDCPKIAAKIKNGIYFERDLLKIVEEYTNCE